MKKGNLLLLTFPLQNTFCILLEMRKLELLRKPSLQDWSMFQSTGSVYVFGITIRVKRKTSTEYNFFHELEVYSAYSNYSRSKTLWFTPSATHRWTYVQLPLISDKDNVMVRSSKKTVVKLISFTVHWHIYLL